jgi:hypothetical protein
VIHWLCGRKTSFRILWPRNPQSLSTAAGRPTTGTGYTEARTRAAPDCYPSAVCSIDDPVLRRVAEAIDQLEADRRVMDPAGLQARIAAVWSMVSEIDPELARLASGYQNRADGA